MATSNDVFSTDLTPYGNNSDLLENFDFDQFLKSEETDVPTSSIVNSTISEDLAEGKTTLKNKALKHLVRDVKDIGTESGKTLDERNTGMKKYHQFSLAEPSSGRKTSNDRNMTVADSTFDSVSSSARPPDKSPIYSVPEARSFGDASDIEGYAGGFREQLNENKGEEVLSRKQEDSLPTSQQLQDYSAYGIVASNKRKAISTSTLAGKMSKRSRVDHDIPSKTEEISYNKTYSNLVTIIYMIHCLNDWADYHEALAYEDAPLFTKRSGKKRSKLVHVNGARPIHDLDDYLNEGNDKTAIIEVRHIRCVKNQGLACTKNQALKWYEFLAIKSSTLRQSISDVARCHYNLSLNDRSGIEAQIARLIIFPERLFFFHHLQWLSAYDDTRPHVRAHISGLLEYCGRKYSSDFQEARRLFAQGLVSQKHLDKLFLPNSVVIHFENDIARGFVVSDWPSRQYDGKLLLHCWAWQNNGTTWCRNSQTFHLPPISDSHVSIRSLKVYPVEFGLAKTTQMLIERGRKLWDLKDPSYVSYTGYDVQGDDFYPESRFMIDYSVYKKMHEYASALSVFKPSTYDHDSWKSQLSPKEAPSVADLIVMPNTVHGFYLTEKHWVCIHVDGVHRIKWNKGAYDRLVIPPETKELVRALVAVRSSQRGIKHGLGIAGKRIDILAGKGNGLIMLLHGGPGTGKSLTAESVAEVAEMPLYRVTCHDVGTTPEAVEKYMGTVMHLGVTWNCILLLDEADVFLEERSMSDLARNSLVSVFLRILEYYDGILILTSNRIGTFDEAFKSRIQVALHYEKLTISSRRQIWTNFIDMLEEDEEDVNFEEIRYHLDGIAKTDLNGRQIRNTMTTARQLAIYHSERLDWRHIEQALSVSTGFNEYIRKLQGHTDEQRMRDRELR